MRRISHITGRALPMRGNDIDTDRIIPARFLRSVTFDGMEQHVFEDDRKSAGGPYNRHPFDVKHFQGAAVLLVNSNFQLRFVPPDPSPAPSHIVFGMAGLALP